MPAKKSLSKSAKKTKARGSYTHKKRETQLFIEQAALYRLSVALTAETEPQAMMDVAVRAAADLFKVEVAAISLVDEGGETYSDRVNIGWPPETVLPEQHIPLDINNGLTYAIRNQKVVAIPDESAETRFGAPPYVMQMGVRSALIAPMIVGSKVIGGLVVNARQPRAWKDDDHRLITLIANNTAEAIERANLFARLEKSERRFRALIEHSADVIVLLAGDGTIKYHSSTARRILGDAVDELIGQNAFERIHPDDLPHAVELYKKLLEARQGSVATEIRYRHTNGSWVWLDATGTNLLDDPDVQAIVANYRDITERKRMEETRTELSRLLEESLNEIYVFDSETLHFVQANYGARHNLGYTLDELRALTPLDLKPEFNAQTFGELIQPVRTGEKPKIVFETRHRRKDNSLYDVEVHLQRATLEGRQVFVTIILDITARKQSELILSESEERFSKVFHSSPVSIAISTFEEGRYVDVNEALLDTLGYDSKDDVIGRTSAELNIWADPTERSKVIEELQQHRLIRNMEFRVRTRSGEVRDTLLTLERIEINHIPFTLGFAIDITERKQAELILRESEERFSKAFHSSPIAIGISTLAEGRIIDVNDAYLRMFGYDSKDEVLGRTTLNLNLYVAGLDERNSLVQQIQQHGHVRNHEGRLRTRSGDERHALTYIELLELNGEQCLLAFTIDITERKRLELQQNRLATALESAGEAILITGADAQIQYVNPAFEYFTGYTRDEALGRNPNILKSGKHTEEFYRAMWSALLQDDVWQGVITNKKKSGDLFESEETIAPIHDAEGNIIGYVAVVRDITDRLRRERELEAIAQLSAALRAAPVLADMMPLLLDQLMDLLNADSATLIMRDAVSGDSVVEAIRGAPILVTGDRLAAGKGVAGYVIESGQTYLSQDLENDPRFARRMAIQGQWAGAFAPLATREQIIGVLFIARRSASIPKEVLRLLNTIGELAASAIHRASLHEQTQRRLEQLSTLHRIDRAISSSFDLRLTFNIALDELTQRAGIGAASVLLLNPHTLIFEYAAERGFRHHLPASSHLSLNQSYPGRAVQERRTIVADLAASAGFPHLDALAKEGFTRYDGVPLIAKGKIRGVLEVFSHPSLGAEQNWVEFLETIANGLALAIDNMELFNGLQRSNSELALAYDATLEGWSRALDLRDKETQGHTQRVTEMTLRLAHAMNLDEREITHLRRGALLHDIGKLGVPDRILLKPGPLTDDEWDVMRQHPQYAYDMLSPIPFLVPALAIPYCHHEKWDGSGYPRGLKVDAIPLAARIFAVADVWDALRSDRPYRRGWEEGKVRDHIREESGKHFDPEVVEVFLALRE